MSMHQDIYPIGRAVLSALAICGLAAQPEIRADQTAIKGERALAISIKLAEKALVEMNNAKDCQVTAMFQERVGGTLQPLSIAKIKARQIPLSMQITFRRPNKGRTIVYQEHKNDGKLIVRQGGLLGVLLPQFRLEPDSQLLRRVSRRPIDASSPWAMTRLLYNDLSQAGDDPNCDATLWTDVTLRDRPCYRICIEHSDADDPRFPFHAFQAYFDKDTHLCVRTERYAWPQNGSASPLMEYYEFLDFSPNVGLTESDFAP